MALFAWDMWKFQMDCIFYNQPVYLNAQIAVLNYHISGQLLLFKDILQIPWGQASLPSLVNNRRKLFSIKAL